MLSCTVENTDKLGQLARIYRRLGRGDDWQRFAEVFRGNEALREVLDAPRSEAA